MRSTLPIASLFLAACAAGPETGSTEHALTCFHTDSAVLCAPGPGSLDEDRTKVDDFYPSACFDGDADLDGTPDFLDLDFLGTPEAAVDVPEDSLRCPRCNRGPGTQNDFRLRIEGDSAELERGKVYARGFDRLQVPTVDGILTIVATPETAIEDGDPAPGAEIRAEGTLIDGELVATRLKVLCPAPAPLPPDDVPPDADPVVVD